MKEPAESKTCQRCGRLFECGLSNGGETCWCFDCPRVMPVAENADCLCPDCLQREIDSFQKMQSNQRESDES